MEEEKYIISAWYEEGDETHFIFNTEINYAPLFDIEEDYQPNIQTK